MYMERGVVEGEGFRKPGPKRKWSLIRSLAALTKSFDDVAQRVERFVDVGPFSDSPFVVRMVVGVGSLTETQQLSH